MIHPQRVCLSHAGEYVHAEADSCARSQGSVVIDDQDSIVHCQLTAERKAPGASCRRTASEPVFCAVPPLAARGRVQCKERSVNSRLIGGRAVLQAPASAHSAPCRRHALLRGELLEARSRISRLGDKSTYFADHGLVSLVDSTPCWLHYRLLVQLILRLLHQQRPPGTRRLYWARRCCASSIGAIRRRVALQNRPRPHPAVHVNER